jgi:hypothetical protein
MDIANTVSTNEFVRKIQCLFKEVFVGVFNRVNFINVFLLKLALVVWILFLCAGLIVSIFGANLEQQKFASTNKIAVNDFVLSTCRLNSGNGKVAGLDNKLVPDVAQCFGSKVQSYFMK